MTHFYFLINSIWVFSLSFLQFNLFAQASINTRTDISWVNKTGLSYSYAHTLNDSKSDSQFPIRKQPNVLFLFIDDLNDWVLHPDQHPEVKTPNIDRLRKMSVNFTNAHATVPVCGPSRLSFFSGLYPEKVDFRWEWSKVPLLQECVPLPLHLRNNGYSVYGIGKLFHQGAGGDFWTEYGTKEGLGVNPDNGPYPWDGKGPGYRYLHPLLAEKWGWDPSYRQHMWDLNYGPLINIPEYKPDPSKDIPGYTGWRYTDGKPFQYNTAEDRDKMPDEIYAEWAVNMLNREHEQPFFIGVGFVRPHTPLHAPKKYFDMFPIEEIKLPPYTKKDLDDCAKPLRDHFSWGYEKFELLAQTEDKKALREWVQAYLACIAFVDDQIGKVLDAVEESAHRDNTIIILAGDHGYHLGEKDYVQKFKLWEESTRVPFFVHVPGFTGNGKSCDHPVSLIDLYPTIVDLCGLPEHPNKGKSDLPLDGFSLRLFLENPSRSDWDGPPVALSAIYDHEARVNEDQTIPHYSVRSRQYRYTLCTNGEEELYNHKKDPNEWNNLANNSEYVKIKQKLRNQLFEIIKPYGKQKEDN